MFRQENKFLSGISSAGIFLILFGVILSFFEIINLSCYKKEPIDINEVYDWRDLKVGSHVESDIYYVWDYAYSNVSSHKVAGVTVDETEDSRVYLIPYFFYSPSDNEYYVDSFIGFQSHDFRVLDAMAYELDDWYHATGTAFPQDYCKTTYHFDGKVTKAGKKDYELMVAYFVEQGMNQADAEDMVLPIIIKPLNYSSTRLIVGIVLTVLGIIVLVATIVTKKKEDAKYVAFARSDISNNVNTVSNNEPQYYGPEGLSSEVKSAPTYKYGGTNTYGTNNVYSSSYEGHGSQIDEDTGLSSEFLERMAREKEDRERQEANQRAMEANAAAYAANPLFGNEPAATPISASQSFSAYDKVVDQSTLNQQPVNNSGLAVDPSILYGTAPAQPAQTVFQPAYQQPASQSPLLGAPQANPYQADTAYQQAQPTQPVQLPTGGSVAPQALAPSSSPVTLPSGNGIYSTSGTGNTTL